MFICLHVNARSGGGVERPLLEVLSCEAVRFVNTSAHGGTVVRANTHLHGAFGGKKSADLAALFASLIKTGCSSFV